MKVIFKRRFIFQSLVSGVMVAFTLLGARVAGELNLSSIRAERDSTFAAPGVSAPVNLHSPAYGYQIINSYPHDVNAFTQGLIFHEGFLYESTGIYGRSGIRKVELETGNILQEQPLPRQFFGEGMTLWKDKLIQLTWHRGIGIVYDKRNFNPLYKFSYSTEGWGITHDGRYLIMSDGSPTLYFRDPETFRQIKKLLIREGNIPVGNLNELEYVDGEIYANVWPTDYIVRIAPETGQVLGWIDLQKLLGEQERTPSVNALNGIAYDEEQDRLFVTGKYWPKLFEIKLTQKD